jgi:hypothetical protein
MPVYYFMLCKILGKLSRPSCMYVYMHVHARLPAHEHTHTHISRSKVSQFEVCLYCRFTFSGYAQTLFRQAIICLDIRFF